MTGDDGFERKLAKHLNKEIDPVYSYRRKQHRFSSQDIDLLVDSSNSEHYAGIECKSKQVKKTGEKLYFSKGFSVNKDGEHQVPRITEFLKKTGRDGYLALAYRRGRGKSVQWFCIDWMEVRKRYNSEEYNGIPKKLMEEKGFRIDENPKELEKIL